jgi:oligopeptide/dipeptide ABC transporter ATP-binding protein
VTEPLLEIDGLHVEFPTDEGTVTAVDGLTFTVGRNEVLGIVGESGSGKTVTAMAALGLLPDHARVKGEIRLDGRQLVGLAERDLRSVRGLRIAMVFQDALAALNPVLTVGSQIAEAVRAHDREIGRADVRQRVRDLLELVGIPADREARYPHEFSGGMRQRAMIGMAIANDPDVLIADEPTTALDVTVQAHVLDVLERVRERTKASLVLITHDLGVVAGMADRVLVMYAGTAVELGSVEQIFYETRHPYTLGLLASLPRIDRGARDDRLFRIAGSPPSLLRVPTGCPFHPRCFRAELPEPCSTIRPDPFTGASGSHLAACHFAGDVATMTPDDLRTRASR